MERIVIVGASLAGLRAAETLRTGGFDGRITVVGAEAHQPYDRPPLSKQVLTGAWGTERIFLRQPDRIADLGVEWRLGVRATGLDVAAREVALDPGGAIGFDGLVIATGAAPRRLPEAMTAGRSDDGPSLHVLRTVDDSIALRDRISSGDRRVVVIGAGFVGLEAAAAARSLGNEVAVLEAGPAPLMRALGADLGHAVAACHADHGVDVRCDTEVVAIDDRGVIVRGDDGDDEVVPADVVVVGIGVVPSTDWLEGSGLELDDGIVCDASLGTGIDGITAAGDVARWKHELFDEVVRIEHWTNAAEQGAAAAEHLLAHAAGETPEPYAAVPFFWSDQYDRRVQFLGRAGADDEVEIVAGSVDERRFVALYARAGRLRGVLGMNSPKLVMPHRRLLSERASLDDARALVADA